MELLFMFKQKARVSTSENLLLNTFRILRACLIGKLKLTLSVFKQPYTHFHSFFQPHVFQKITNNITQIPLLNGP